MMQKIPYQNKLYAFIVLVFLVLPTFLKAQHDGAHPKATWIWYPGDYEIWLSNQMQAKRTERGAFFPPLWRYYSPYPLVTFRKKLSLKQDDVVQIHTEGQAKIQLDGKLYYGDPLNLVDRKSTRLNSSHVKISYAVFCLKKKKK